MKRNKIFAKVPCNTIILLLCLALLLSACSGNSSNGATADPVSTGGEPAVTTGGNDDITPPEPPPVAEDPTVPGEVKSSIQVNTYTPPGDSVTFTMFVGETGKPPASGNKIVKMIEEYTGVHIDMEFLVGDLETKMGVMNASGDYPDIVAPGQGRAKFMEAGAFIPLDDLLPQYPNLWNHYSPYLGKLRAVDPDGNDNIYILDTWQRYYWYGDNTGDYLDDHIYQAFWIQKDVMAEAGYPIPKTLDEFFDIIEAYYKKYPTIDGAATIPFEIQSIDSTGSFSLKNPPQHMIGAGNDGDAFVDPETFTAEIYQNKWYAEAYYKKLNEVYKKGLISPETFTLNKDQYLSRVATGRVLAMFDAWWNFETAEKLLIAEDKWNRTYVPLGLTYEGYEQGYMDAPTFVGGNGIGISVKAKDPARILTYMDTLLNEDLQRLMSWGIEGTDYYVTEDGRYRLTPEQKTNFDNPDWINENNGKPLRDRFPKIEGMFSDGNAANWQSQPEIRAENASEYDIDFFSHYPFTRKSGFLSAKEKAAYYPIWGYSIKKGTDAKIAFDDITDTQLRYLPGVIMADDFESAWAEYAARYDNINYKAYEDELNRQIAQRMGIDR